MLAIPVFRARIAPVLDWCSKIIIFPEDGTFAASCRQMDVTKENMFRLMQNLREQGIKTLICGALSPEMLNYGESIGLKIIHGVAGEIEEVLQAYRERRLDQPRYWLPGCGGPRGYKGVEERGRARKEGGMGSPGGKGKTSTRTRGPGGFCTCPQCGAREQHERGIPCSKVECPACRKPMTRS